MKAGDLLSELQEFPESRVAEHEIETCYYCGLPADSVDHVTPKTIADRIGELGIDPTRVYTVPCCRECNSLLGPRWFPTLTARKLFLKDLLRHRYRKLLACPAWTEEEILILGPTLQSHVRKLQSLKTLVQDRIRF